MNTNERRVHPRIPYRASTQIASSQHEPAEGGTVDISRGGALLDSPLHVSVGHEVTLDFRTRYAPVSGVRARVKRSHPVFWGHRFLLAVEFREPVDDLLEIAEMESRG